MEQRPKHIIESNLTLNWGIENESVAKEKQWEIIKGDICDCGLDINKVYFFLGTFLDQIIGVGDQIFSRNQMPR